MILSLFLLASQLTAADQRDDPFSEGSATQKDLPVSTKILRYTELVIAKYDKNKDGLLQESEWASMRGEPKSIDTDTDGRISPAEYAQFVVRYGRYRRILLITPDPSDENPQPYEADASAGDVELNRRSKKFFVPKSRLPKGLPQAFFDRDIDGDGQLTPKEFSPSSTPAEIEQFQKLDANLDGVVTAKEYARGPQKATPATTTESPTAP